ncbi:hypothetical protein D3C86_1959750 [compost metagenome]
MTLNSLIWLCGGMEKFNSRMDSTILRIGLLRRILKKIEAAILNKSETTRMEARIRFNLEIWESI